MKIVEIAFTGFPVTNLKRAREFYEGVLGLKVSHLFGDETKAWIEYDIGAGTLSIGNGLPEWKPNPGGGSVGLEVADFDSAIQRLKASQVTFYHEPMETPVCRIAVVADPDGNSICIHKRHAHRACEETGPGLERLGQEDGHANRLAGSQEVEPAFPDRTLVDAPQG